MGIYYLQPKRLNLKTAQGFNVDFVYFATVPPYDSVKKEKNKDLYSTLLTLEGEMTDYLIKIFDNAQDDCKVEILFNSNDAQENNIRSIIMRLANNKTIAAKENAAYDLAMKLYEVTDHRNETGLFIIIVGKKNNMDRIVLCRFKRHEGLYSQGKVLQYLKNFFTKSSHYKLAVYEDIPSEKSFWKGYAIDRQTSTTTYKPFSYFWIEDFLQSRTAITSVQGTSQLSKVMKILLKQTPEITDQEQIISAVTNLKSKRDVQISVKNFCNTYLSPELTKAVQKIVVQEGTQDFYHSVFSVDKDIMQKELGATVLTLDEGITAYVPTFKYAKHVQEELLNGRKNVTIKGTLKGKRINTGKEPLQTEKKIPNRKNPK